MIRRLDRRISTRDVGLTRVKPDRPNERRKVTKRGATPYAARRIHRQRRDADGDRPERAGYRTRSRDAVRRRALPPAPTRAARSIVWQERRRRWNADGVEIAPGHVGVRRGGDCRTASW